MGLAGRESSSKFVMLTPSSSPKNNEKICSIRREDGPGRPRRPAGARNSSLRLRIHELDPVCKSRNKASAIFLASEGEEDHDDADFDRRFGEEGWFDDDEGMWLSSGTMSPPSCFDDHRFFSILLNLSLDERLVSLLSIVANSGPSVGNDIIFFDGSRVNPIEEAFLVLERTSSDSEQILQEDLKEEEVVTLLLSSIDNYPMDSDSQSSSDNSSSPFKNNIDSRFQSWDSERTGFCLSLFNLEGEDSKWISDTDSDLDYTQSGFPSPSYKNSWGSEVQSSNSTVSSFSEVIHEYSQSVSSSENVSEDLDLADLAADGPLFWPSDRKSDWDSDVKQDFFIMSPRNHRHKDGTSEKTSPESMRFSLHNREMDFKEGCKSRLLFSSRSISSKIFELKRTNGVKDVRRMKTMPSRLGKFAKFSTKIIPLDTKDDVVEPKSEKVVTEKSEGKYTTFMEEDFASNEGLPLETLLGIGEFDGHEGIEPEFNKDDFSLDGFL